MLSLCSFLLFELGRSYWVSEPIKIEKAFFSSIFFKQLILIKQMFFPKIITSICAYLDMIIYCFTELEPSF